MWAAGLSLTSNLLYQDKLLFLTHTAKALCFYTVNALGVSDVFMLFLKTKLDWLRLM